MARYIDADKLITALCDCTEDTWGKGLGASWWAQSVKLKDNMVECINNQPTADVVEVVRCMDCKHNKPQNISKQYNHKTLYCCRSATIKVDADDYCSYGERK